MLKAIGLLLIVAAIPAAIITWIWLAALGVYDVIQGVQHGADFGKIFVGLLLWFGKELLVTVGASVMFLGGAALYGRE